MQVTEMIFTILSAASLVLDKPFLTEPLATPDISDMEEDLMSYEMDFHNDISSIL